MKKSLFLVLMVSLILCACNSDKATFKKGVLLYEQGKTLSAVQTFSSLIKADPKNAAAYAARAAAFDRLSKEKKEEKDKYQALAEEDFFSALALEPQNAEILNNIGAFYIEKGLFINALVYLNDALKYNPTYVLAYVNRGIANYRSGRGNQAWADFNMALQLDPKNLLAHYNRGLMFYDWEMYLPAIDDLTFVVEMDPKSARALVERGRIFQAAKYYAQAMEDYRRATIINPNYYLAFYHYGEMLFKKGEYENALTQLQIAKELNNTYAPAYDLMGDMLAVEDPLSAAANYVIAKRLDPQNEAFYNTKMQQMLSDLGRKEVVEKRFI